MISTGGAGALRSCLSIIAHIYFLMFVQHSLTDRFTDSGMKSLTKSPFPFSCWSSWPWSTGIFS